MTGGTGLVGDRLAERLPSKGVEVRCLVPRARPPPRRAPRAAQRRAATAAPSTFGSALTCGSTRTLRLGSGMRDRRRVHFRLHAKAGPCSPNPGPHRRPPGTTEPQEAGWRAHPFRHSSSRVPETTRIGRYPPRSADRPPSLERCKGPAIWQIRKRRSCCVAPRRSPVRVRLAPSEGGPAQAGFRRFGGRLDRLGSVARSGTSA